MNTSRRDGRSSRREVRRRDGQRFVDPAVEPVYQAIKSLDLATQHELRRWLSEKLRVDDVAGSGQSAREARALLALHDAASELGHSPSVREYRELQARHRDDEDVWPEERFIRRWLGAGAWNEALRRAHLDAVPDGDVLVFQQGPHYTGEEIIAALQECHADLGLVESWPQYLAWVRRRDVRERPGRRPKSFYPFTRVFGSFHDALRAAGLLSGDPAEARLTLVGLRRAEYRVSDATLRHALIEVAERLGRSPRVHEYLAERLRIYEETLEQGHPRALPSYGTLNRRFGASWDDLLIWAGLKPLGGRGTGNRTPRGPQPQVTDDDICASIRAAYEDEGEPFTVDTYRLWREEQLTQTERWERRRYPSYHTIWSRYGSWSAACEAALGPRS